MSLSLRVLRLNELDDRVVGRLEALLDRSHPGSEQASYLREVRGFPGLTLLAEDDRDGLLGTLTIAFLPRDQTAATEDMPDEIVSIAGRVVPCDVAFSVIPEARGQGIGRQLLEKGHELAVAETGSPFLTGSTWSMGSLRLYAATGAFFRRADIDHMLPNATLADNRRWFHAMVTDPLWTDLRFRETDFWYAWATRDESAKVLRAIEWLPFDELACRPERVNRVAVNTAPLYPATTCKIADRTP